MSAPNLPASAYRTSPLTGRDRTALETLVHSFGSAERAARFLTSTDPDQVDVDRVTATMSGQRRLEGPRRALARLLLRHVAGMPLTADATLDAAEAELAQQLRAAEAPEVSGAPRPAAKPPPWAFVLAGAGAGALLREIGLEELDISAHLLFSAGEEPVLGWEPIPPETAHVWLLGSLYDRVEASIISAPPLLDLEREASRWWFERWTGPSRRSSEEERFARGVREQEWSLVERPTIALDAPVTTWFCATPQFHHEPPRQQRMARALRRSFASVFAVRSAEGLTSVLEDLVDGREYTVHEHNQPLAYRSGWLALGRLIPFDGRRYLRSPGMLLFLPQPGERGSALARGFAAASETLGPAIALEAIMTTIVSRVRVPRDLGPAPSRAEACEWRAELMDVMDQEGLREPVPVEQAPAELRRLAHGEASQFYAYAVDDVVGAWADALSRQCESGRSARRQHRDRPVKSPRKGRRKKRS